jgi:hypothetical protein
MIIVVPLDELVFIGSIRDGRITSFEGINHTLNVEE